MVPSHVPEGGERVCLGMGRIPFMLVLEPVQFCLLYMIWITVYLGGNWVWGGFHK